MSEQESAPQRYLVCQISVKTDNFEFFWPKFGEIACNNYVQYFCSNNVEGVAENWMEAEMCWVEVDRAGWS